METEKKLPKYDEPISPELAQEYVKNYLSNNKFKPEDFQAFYFHRDEIQLVLDQNKEKEYIKFTLGMKQLDKEKWGDKLYGCVMMTNSNIIIGDMNPAAQDDSGIYDFSRPVPPHPPTEG